MHSLSDARDQSLEALWYRNSNTMSAASTQLWDTDPVTEIITSYWRSTIREHMRRDAPASPDTACLPRHSSPLTATSPASHALMTLRVSVRDTAASVRFFEWRRYPPWGLGAVATQPFCAFVFA